MKRKTKLKGKYSPDFIKENIELYLIMLPVLVLIFIFCYIPMYGLVIAFQNYTPGASFLSFDGSIEWVGLEHFITFIESEYFFRLIKNTVLLSLYGIIFGFWVPIAFALLMNEVRHTKFKTVAQTTSYMPYFISAVVVAGMAIDFLQPDGFFNLLFGLFGAEPQSYITSSEAFPFIYTSINIWRNFGFGSILYFATISAIDPELYESARLDGANRWQQMIHITLPYLTPIISIQLIMAVGSMLSANTDLILLLYGPATYETADVIGTYIYRVGIEGGQFSYTTAVGVFTSVINFVLLFSANKISNKLTDSGLW